MAELEREFELAKLRPPSPEYFGKIATLILNGPTTAISEILRDLALLKREMPRTGMPAALEPPARRLVVRDVKDSMAVSDTGAYQDRLGKIYKMLSSAESSESVLAFGWLKPAMESSTASLSAEVMIGQMRIGRLPPEASRAFAPFLAKAAGTGHNVVVELFVSKANDGYTVDINTP